MKHRYIYEGVRKIRPWEQKERSHLFSIKNFLVQLSHELWRESLFRHLCSLANQPHDVWTRIRAQSKGSTSNSKFRELCVLRYQIEPGYITRLANVKCPVTMPLYIQPKKLISFHSQGYLSKSSLRRFVTSKKAEFSAPRESST